MKIEVINGKLVLYDIFNGVLIPTPSGAFAVAERDGGIEVMRDGQVVWSSEVDDDRSRLHRDAARWRAVLERADEIASTIATARDLRETLSRARDQLQTHLYELTSGLKKHPVDYTGPCHCAECCEEP